MTELLYVPGRGVLYRLDPRSKFLFAAILMLYLALESRTGTLLLALAALHVLALYCQGTRTRVLPLWCALSPLLLAVVTLGSLRWRAEPALLTLGPIAVTLPALWGAIGAGVRIAGISLAVSFVLWTTEPGDAVAGLVRLGVPFTRSFPFVMTLQYVVTFRRQFQYILEAQQSRGLTFSRGNPFQVARAYIPVLVPLIISALRSVDSLALALQSRGFAAGQQRTSRRVLRTQARDWAFLLATGCLLFALARLPV
jgi:energy-coupling factor transport system permease protein